MAFATREKRIISGIQPALGDLGFAQFAFSANPFFAPSGGASVSVGSPGSVARPVPSYTARESLPRLVIQPPPRSPRPTDSDTDKVTLAAPIPVLQPISDRKGDYETSGEPETVQSRPWVGVVVKDATGDTSDVQGVSDVGWSDVFSSVLSTAAPILQSKYGVGPDVGPYSTSAFNPQMGFMGPVMAQPGPSSVFGDATSVVQPAAGAAVMQNGDCSACPSPGPRYAKICLATNVISPLRRRRRKRLFTAGDLRDIASLKAIVGGGAALNAAVVKAIR